MKFHRLTLRNYRGVEEATVEFAETGVTVIEGDNEVGKTSLAEAIGLILQYQDNSTARPVRAVQPVGKDLGAEIELEASMGTYQFTYRKRFHRNRLTELGIHEPSPENLVGREAHDRVQQIFHETTDEGLFWALWLQQGVALDQADISDKGTLGAALDRAAGREVAGEAEHSLYGRVEQESTRYWTPTGQPNKDFQTSKSARDDAQTEVDRLAADLKKLDETVQLAASLQNEIGSLEPQHEEQRNRVNELEQTSDSVEKKEGQVERLRLETELAATDLAQAKQRVKTRVGLEAELKNAESAWSQMQPDWENLTPSLESAQRDFDGANRLWSEAKGKADEAARLARLREEDYEHHRNLLDLEMMKERRGRISEAQQHLQRAEGFLETCEIDDGKLAELEEAQTTLFRAEANLAGQGAQLEFVSRAAQGVEFNGDFRQLSPDQEVRETITERFIFRLPDVADITVTPGSGAQPSKSDVETATAQLNEKLAYVSVLTVEEARRLNRDRARAKEARIRAKEAIDRDLRDLTVDQLQARVHALESKTGTYMDQRTASEPLPKDFDEAQGSRNAARTKAGQSGTEASEFEEGRSSAEEVLRQLKDKERELGWQRRSAEDRLSGARVALEEAREADSDADLQELLQQDQDKASKAKERHATEKKALEALNPESVRAEYETAVGVETRMREKLNQLGGELRDVRTFLRVRGEEGLQSQYDHAQSQHEHTSSVYKRLDGRAQAVRLLYETLTRHREDARRAYLAPLKEKIEGFGRIVFGPTFSVELGDDLRIARRTLDGITIEFEDLSTGAREQLGVLSRLACASIAADDGGVPFILDDALGWSDPDRLQRIGAALTVGSRDCQVIALTCMPGRYQHVDAKKVIRLPTTV